MLSQTDRDFLPYTELLAKRARELIKPHPREARGLMCRIGKKKQNGVNLWAEKRINWSRIRKGLCGYDHDIINSDLMKVIIIICCYATPVQLLTAR